MAEVGFVARFVAPSLVEPVCIGAFDTVGFVAAAVVAVVDGGGVGAVYLTLVGGLNLEDTLADDDEDCGAGAFFASSVESEWDEVAVGTGDVEIMIDDALCD